jgi:hypothetical protein
MLSACKAWFDSETSSFRGFLWLPKPRSNRRWHVRFKMAWHKLWMAVVDIATSVYSEEEVLIAKYQVFRIIYILAIEKL